MFRSSKFAFLAIAAVLLALPATSQQVGVTSSSAGEPRGTPPAQNERILRVGIDIQASERVRTGVNDRAHLVFLDGSALTVGVDSDLVIDRFVYDPNTKVGDIAMTATQGAFRFVGGAISKQHEVVVHTPSADIGVRGGIALWTIAPSRSLLTTFLYGQSMLVRNSFGSQLAFRFGSQILAEFGHPPTPPFVPPPGSLQAYIRLFERSQAAGNIISPGDQVVIDTLAQNFNKQQMPYTDVDPALVAWLNYLQAIAAQGITVQNANRPKTQRPTNSTPPPHSTCFGNC